MDPVLLQALQILGPLLGAGLGVKFVLNGTVERVRNIEIKMDESLRTQIKHGERLARLEQYNQDQ